MCQLITVLITDVFFIIFSLSSIPSIVSVSNIPKLKLIHKDSSYSPFYKANISTIQRSQRDSEISYQRASYYESITMNKDVRILFHHINTVFTAEISIGFPPSKQFFQFDTGSDFTWLQCKPCQHCFEQDLPLFEPKKSKYGDLLNPTHSLAYWFNCTTGVCMYERIYHSGQITKGFVSTDDFLLDEHYFELVYGCGIHNTGFPNGFRTSGILGMNNMPLSLLNQLKNETEKRFSYCIPSSASRSTYVTFGDEAKISSRNFQTIPFIDEYHYKLNLIGISVNRRRMTIHNTAFSDGFFIDSGSVVSLLKQEALDVVIQELRSYFRPISSIKRHAISSRDLCYKYRKNHDSVLYPNMTLHFEGADLEVPPTNLFREYGTYFCLEVRGSQSVSLWGSVQQQNTRFVYDNQRGTLSFVEEIC